MQIVCFFNWNLGYLTLSKLIQNKVEIFAVVTNYDLEDKEDFYRNKVYHLAIENGINVYRSYKDVVSKVSSEMIGFSVAYGNEIFKKDILDKICVYNFHPSFLPLFKGPSPIEWQIRDEVTEVGMSCHRVIEAIDSGDIISQEKFLLNYEQTFLEFLDEFNNEFSKFVVQNIMNIINGQNDMQNIKKNREGEYYHRLSLPMAMRRKKLYEIKEYLNRKRVVFFAGNRAELGILLPLIIEFSKDYYVDLLISESYFQNGNNDYIQIKEMLHENESWVNFVIISQKDMSYIGSLSDIYEGTYKYLFKQDRYPYQFALVLGDRIEAMAFALATFYSKIPLIHVGGGDIANVPYYDTNIRHSISKLASLHFTFSEESRKTLCQLGEEGERIVNIGNPTFDYKRLGMLSQYEQIKNELGLVDGYIAVFTYHACPFYSENKNLQDFLNSLNGVIESNIEQIVITYPNYDPSSKKILRNLKNMKDSDRIIIRESLGTIKLDTIMNKGNCIIVGNSSSGLLETLFYKVPAINIGTRQTDRIRGNNVYDVAPQKDKIKECINYIIDNYDKVVERINKAEQIFGDGYAGVKAINFLDKYIKLESNEIITKKFVKRKIID